MSLRNHFVVPMLSLALCLVLGACGASPSEEPASQPEPESVEQTEPSVGETTTDGSDDEGEQAATTLTRVGEAGIGFVDIPSDFVPFKDVSGGTDLQWSDATGTSIVTLNVFDMETVPEDQRESFTAYDAAQSVYYNISQDSPEDIEGATVELCGTQAYQIYAYYDDGIFLISWVVDGPDGAIHYVSVEGSEDVIMSLVDLVEETYAFDA